MWREFSKRLSYLFRSYMPHGLVGSGGVLYLIFKSLCPEDLDGLEQVAWNEFLHGDFEQSPSLDWVMAQLSSANCISKTLVGFFSVIAAFYVSDVCTTGRKPGWCLIASYGSTSRWDNFRVWGLLCLGTIVVLTTLMVLTHRQTVSWLTAFKIAVVSDALVLSVFMFVNRSFESWLLRLPEIEELRSKRQFERQKKSDVRRQQNAVNEQRRNQLRDVQSQIGEKQQQLDGATREIAALRSSGHDTSLASEAIANLQLQKNQLNEEIRQLYENVPARG